MTVQPWQGYGSMSAPFSGSGQLSFHGLSQIFGRSLALGGDGQLNLGVLEKHARTLDLTGDGGLAFILAGQQLVPLNLGGDGQVVFNALQEFAASIGLAGSGLLALPVVQQLNAPMALGGAGALSIQTQAQRNVALALSGSGQLSIASLYRPAPVPLALSSDGQLAIAVPINNIQFLGASPTNPVAENPASPASWTDTVPTGTTCVVLWVPEWIPSTAQAMTATFNGTAMTPTSFRVGSFASGGTYYINLNLFTLLITAPSSPLAATFKITEPNKGAGSFGWVGAAYYSRVASLGTPLAQSQAGGVTALAHAVANSNPNTVYAQCFAPEGSVASATLSAYNQAKRSIAALSTGGSAGYASPIVYGDGIGNGGALNFTATAGANAATYGSGSIILPMVSA
jgi:hypothetical protein